MSWIYTIPYAEAKGKLKTLYDRVKGPGNNVDNIMLAHSLRPHTMVGHMSLYKNVLHNSNNTLPKCLLEALGTYVSQLNKCDYCVQHHYAGLVRLVGPEKAERYKKAIDLDDLGQLNSVQEQAAFGYAKALTLMPNNTEPAFNELREQGFSDGEVLEINQVTAYFNYANRTVLGLGVNTDGDVLGLSPGDNHDESNWSHQ